MTVPSRSDTQAIMSDDDPVYQLSARYAPPRVSVRDAQVIDDHGTGFDNCPINHRTPADVTREDLDDYPGSVWTFMDLESQLFYLHAIASLFIALPWPEVLNARFAGSVECYLFLLNQRLQSEYATLSRKDQSAITEAVFRIYQREERAFQEALSSCLFLQDLVLQKMLDEPHS